VERTNHQSCRRSFVGIQRDWVIEALEYVIDVVGNAISSSPARMNVQYGQAILAEARRLLAMVMTQITPPDDLGGWPAGYNDKI